jgi:hypothetical protein
MKKHTDDIIGYSNSYGYNTYDKRAARGGSAYTNLDDYKISNQFWKDRKDAAADISNLCAEVKVKVPVDDLVFVEAAELSTSTMVLYGHSQVRPALQVCRVIEYGDFGVKLQPLNSTYSEWVSNETRVRVITREEAFNFIFTGKTKQ